MLSQVQLFCDPMDCQAPLSLGCPRQEYWSSCHSLLQGIFLTQGVNPCSLALAGATWEALSEHRAMHITQKRLEMIKKIITYYNKLILL